jgi:AcrR family transcriptional regulator
MRDPSKKPRGRPRAYDPDVALARAMEVFWEAGYSGTSLDELGAGMGMNRPSMYAAFGDKESLYLEALRRYRDASRAGIRSALAPDRSLREGLRIVFAGAIELYLAGKGGARGCFLIGTAVTEAARNPKVRDLLRDSVHALDEVFQERMRVAREEGELPKTADVAGRARMASAVLETMSLRARAGEDKATLEAIAASSIDVICPPSAHARARR